MSDESDIDKAVEAVDQMEDEEAAKREQRGDEVEENLIVCPKCKSIVNEQDFLEDELSEMGASSLSYRIFCSKCGYKGMPIEMSAEDYSKLTKKS